MLKSNSHFLLINFLLILFSLATLANLNSQQQFYQYSYRINNVEDDLSKSEGEDYGRLTGDVQNWAAIIQNYIIQSANDLINRDLTQSLFDLANYTVEAKNGEDVVADVKSILSNYFTQKQDAAIVTLFLFREIKYSLIVI